MYLELSGSTPSLSFTLLIVFCTGSERVCDLAPCSSDASQHLVMLLHLWLQDMEAKMGDAGMENAHFIVKCFIY